MATAIVMYTRLFVKGTIGFASYTRFYTTTPAASSIALAEVLITVSLCTLLRVSRSEIPRMKRLVNTLIIYAVNRCLLTLPGADNLFVWAASFDFIVGKLYANSFLASLNTRQHLRSRGSGPESALRVNAAHFASPPKLPGGSSDRKVAVIDITTEPAFDNTTTSSL
ncbi:hypothetical protein F5141DRAFT_1094001 [Pisolithus sp. B1]|nr:hypothetical protein F5141DRAFT_1094001 [Pisolithus sp. B1]